MIFFFRAIRSPSSSRAPRRGGAAFLTFGAFQNFRRNPLYNPAEFPIIAQKLRVIELFLNASAFGGIQFALKFRNFLLQGSVFGDCVCKGDLVLAKLGLHPLHAGDKPFQQGFNFLQLALGVEYICIIHNRLDFPALLGKMGHFFENTRWNMLAVGLTGAFSAFKIRVLADHVFPIIALPLAQFSLVANDLFGTQTVILCQRNECDVHVRGFLVEMHDGGYKGFRTLFLLQKFKRVFKILFDRILRLVLEETGRTGNQNFDHHGFPTTSEEAENAKREDVMLFKSQKFAPHEVDFERIKNVFLSILKDIKKDMDEKEPTSPPVQMEFLKKLMGAIQELSLPKNPPSPEKAVDWTISQLAKQITMSAETRKAYKRAFMMSLHDNGKAQGKK